MLVMTPAVRGPIPISGAPVPVTTYKGLVTRLAIRPRLGQWSKVLVGGPDLLPDDSNAWAVLYPVPEGGHAEAFVVQDTRGQNTIDLSQVFVYATVPGDTPLVESFFYYTI